MRRLIIIPRLHLILALFLLGGAAASATTYELIPFERRLPTIDIVAVVDVGPVHIVITPEGITLESAEATIERPIYRRIIFSNSNTKNTIRLYSLLLNGEMNGQILKQGRAFVMMKQTGIDAFQPTDPWEFQPISSDTIMWPTKGGIRSQSIDDVAKEVIATVRSSQNTNP